MSPTVQTILIGLAVLGAFVFLGRGTAGHKGVRNAIFIFFPIWLAYCIYHLTVGLQHGYSLQSELPLLALNFGLPALLGFWVLKKGISYL